MKENLTLKEEASSVMARCIIQEYLFYLVGLHRAMLGGIPVPTAWRVLGLRMEERPPDMEVSCEYIE
jgi:hypothetical protein